MYYNYIKYSLKRKDYVMNINRTVNFDNGWEFVLLENGAGYDKAASSDGFKPVEIPHDWLIYDTNDLYKNGEGWYRKTFEVTKGDSVFSIDFDGVYMDSTVYVNGKIAGVWHYGYSSFSFDITDLLTDGENTVMVRVCYVSPNSRWYSGAGIYRSVYLTQTNKTHILNNGLYVTANAENGAVHIDTEAVGEFDSVIYTVYDTDGNKIAEYDSADFTVPDHKLWSLETPEVYTLSASLVKDGNILDTYETTFGFRSIKLDPDNGFSLNGKYMKLKGVCLHHDMGALGAAVNRRAIERQLMCMKEMGANAIRTSHNMPARELLEICDRIGLLVNCESFDMWELHKTEFDNARFFKETAHADVESWIKRDRNHPCIIMWSIGNEIYDTHASEHGLEIAKMLAGYVREFDPNKHAEVTIGSNYIEWENAQKVGEFLVNSGYNYTERCYDEHHKKYPSTVIYGSETSSEVRSRGIYHFPAAKPLLTHDDNQCSSLGNSCVVWGKPAEKAWIEDRDRKFCAGQFVWTGIDYIGEPTPYSSKNSFFGMMDTACFPKDAYYFYQSVWSDKPMIHLLPYWDFNDGQIIDVIAYSTADCAELFLNGKSLGKQNIDHKHGDVLHFAWSVPYEKGELKAVAYDENGNAVAEDVQRSFGNAAKIVLSADRTEILSGGRDLVFIEISAADENGTFAANARNYVKVEVSGSGRLMGLDNGDSTDYEQYKTDTRRLFSGKLLAIVSSDNTEGEIKIKVTSNGLEAAEVSVNVKGRSDVCCEKLVPQIRTDESVNGDITPMRKIEAEYLDTASLNAEKKTAKVRYRILPENADFSDISCKAVSESSVPVNFAEAKLGEDNTIEVTAKGDGKFTLRIYGNNGSKYPQVISDLPFEITGLGQASIDPYSEVLACTYKFSSEPITIMEHGAVGGIRSRTAVGFSSVEFGKNGSDTLTLYLGNCNNRDIPVELYAGDPDNGGELIEKLMFPHNNGWDKPYPCKFTLSKPICGTVDLYFVFSDNNIFGGFTFADANDPFSGITAAAYENIYGDEFEVSGNKVINIGNNVVIDFGELDFGSGTDKIEIVGSTPNEINAIQIRYNVNGVQKTELVNFKHSIDYGSQCFDIEKITGKTAVSFVFMPGTNFNFDSFRFI